MIGADDDGNLTLRLGKQDRLLAYAVLLTAGFLTLCAVLIWALGGFA